MKTLSLLLTACALIFGACAGAPKKSDACSASSAKMKCCPADAPHGKAKPKAS